MTKRKRIQGYLLFFGVLVYATGCLSAPGKELPDNTREMGFSEYLFRYLMAKTNLMESRNKGCLVFGNPLKTPSDRFLARFDDLNDHLIRLEQIYRGGTEAGYRDRASGSPVIFYQIIRIIRLGQDTCIMEAGWVYGREHSRRGLYAVVRAEAGFRVREIRVSDRCRHVITSHSGTTKPLFFSRRLAF